MPIDSDNGNILGDAQAEVLGGEDAQPTAISSDAANNAVSDSLGSLMAFFATL